MKYTFIALAIVTALGLIFLAAIRIYFWWDERRMRREEEEDMQSFMRLTQDSLDTARSMRERLKETKWNNVP